MEPQLLNRKSNLNRSIQVNHHKGKHFLKMWHFHPEFELVAITKSNGTRFIGDHVEKFDHGEVVLIGENLPHLWLNDEFYFDENCRLKAEALVIHFNRNFAGETFFQMPEMIKINELLDQSRRGLKFSKESGKVIIRKMKRIQKLDDFNRISEFLKLLHWMAHAGDKTILSSVAFLQSFKISKKKKLDSIYEYIINNFQNKITLENMADMANMNKSAFCRYFKNVNGKTFSQYVNEVRIGFACKMLLEQEKNISEISYQCGFNNLSNFNRQFKNITKYSPSEYLEWYLAN